MSAKVIPPLSAGAVVVFLIISKVLNNDRLFDQLTASLIFTIGLGMFIVGWKYRKKVRKSSLALAGGVGVMCLCLGNFILLAM